MSQKKPPSLICFLLSLEGAPPPQGIPPDAALFGRCSAIVCCIKWWHITSVTPPSGNPLLSRFIRGGRNASEEPLSHLFLTLIRGCYTPRKESSVMLLHLEDVLPLCAAFNGGTLWSVTLLY
ncbi:hypothetical protein CEXT_191981 [Caerostris extrusa]|uniref:Secreted protein n=1 Tax=Caerostris extrusa TaxID=172846 RepID=A0AAV4UWB3_CAEEX|nr:hypothetical protein CEXT_191981 [Caerostris extrusa]